MIPVTEFSGRTVVVYGFGRSGRSACMALRAGGSRVLVGDDSQEGKDRALSQGFEIMDSQGVDWREVAALVLSPGIPLAYPRPHRVVQQARMSRVEIIGDTELFERVRRKNAPGSFLVAVTGTNGKSTTTSLIAHILLQAGRKAITGGNIGIPVLDVDSIRSDEIYVHEYSSYQLDLTPSIAPDIGILLNLSPDHLDRHGTMENYCASKEHLVKATSDRGGLSVVCVDDPFCRQIARRLDASGGRSPIVRIAEHMESGRGFFLDHDVLCERLPDGVREIMPLAHVKNMPGLGNWRNAAAAIAACRAVGMMDDGILSEFRSFKGLKHRMEPVDQCGHVLFINDSKATNAAATACALESFGNIYWIVGGRAKGGGIQSLSPLFPRVAHAFLIGESSDDFAEFLDGKLPFTLCGDLQTAVGEAVIMSRKEMQSAVTILLSPACASFDQFTHFEERGDAFRAFVRQMIQSGAVQAEDAGF